VRDPASGRVLFSRGYASVYAEWESTVEAKKTSGPSANRSASRGRRLPSRSAWPDGPAEPLPRGLDLRRRPGRLDDEFRAAPAAGKVIPLFENGPPESKVDSSSSARVTTAAEEAKFVADANRLVGLLFGKYEPFKSRKSDFNVRLLHLPSAESGVFRPFSKIFRRTPLSAQYGIFGSERYVLTYDDRALREPPRGAVRRRRDPRERLAVRRRRHLRRPGDGGGAHGMGGVRLRPRVRHHFAALADEYYTSDVAYETGAADRPEPWEPNVTALKTRRT